MFDQVVIGAIRMSVPFVAEHEIIARIAIDHVVADDDVARGWSLCHDRWTNRLNDVVGDEVA